MVETKKTNHHFQETHTQTRTWIFLPYLENHDENEKRLNLKSQVEYLNVVQENLEEC